MDNNKIEINEREYDIISYDQLPSTATDNERKGVVSGRMEFYDMSTFIYILIIAIIIVNLVFLFIKFLNKKIK